MRWALFASAACLSLSTLAVTGPSSPTPESAQPSPAIAVNNEAAAKHAKRTACLKDAKDKKLVGPDKSAFLKSCIAAPGSGS